MLGERDQLGLVPSLLDTRPPHSLRGSPAGSPLGTPWCCLVGGSHHMPPPAPQRWGHLSGDKELGGSSVRV